MTRHVETVEVRPPARTLGSTVLDSIAHLGNRFPDPVVLFIAALGLTWVPSHLLAGHDFGLTDPRTAALLRVADQLTLPALAVFISGMTQAFVAFPPLGVPSV